MSAKQRLDWHCGLSAIRTVNRCSLLPRQSLHGSVMRGGVRRTEIKTCRVQGVDKGKQGATGGQAPALGGSLGGSAGTPVSACAGPSNDQKGATVYLAMLVWRVSGPSGGVSCSPPAYSLFLVMGPVPVPLEVPACWEANFVGWVYVWETSSFYPSINF